MAVLLNIENEVEKFTNEYFYRQRQADEHRQKENQAATHIQSWFRGCKVRAYLSHLHKKAVIIQKIWRGFTARAHFRQMVKAAYFTMKMDFYNEMAVRIQRRWRGFFVRQYIHNFYARKNYLEGLARKNEIVRRQLNELETLQKRERDCLEMMKEQTSMVKQAHKLHHLLSTKQRPGVFNSPFRQVPHEIEQLLRQVKYQAPTRLSSRNRTRPLGTSTPEAPSLPRKPGSPRFKINRTCLSPRLILPPIVSKQQQSLLEEPGEVWEKRMNCPDLMSRLQTSRSQLEEVQNQLRHHKSIILHGGSL
ncbi:uncharacterized protein V6R79_024285 [Siganus canaliculatus]